MDGADSRRRVGAHLAVVALTAALAVGALTLVYAESVLGWLAMIIGLVAWVYGIAAIQRVFRLGDRDGLIQTGIITVFVVGIVDFMIRAR